MDKFEQTMKDLAGMSKEDQGKTIEKLKGMCICPGCPTYTKCAKNNSEILFCATGKSFMCIDQEKGCSCPACPVAKDLGLKYKSFCTRGAEKAQRFEQTIWGSTLVR